MVTARICFAFVAMCAAHVRGHNQPEVSPIDSVWSSSFPTVQGCRISDATNLSVVTSVGVGSMLARLDRSVGQSKDTGALALLRVAHAWRCGQRSGASASARVDARTTSAVALRRRC
jgi:hypothetical protein